MTLADISMMPFLSDTVMRITKLVNGMTRTIFIGDFVEFNKTVKSNVWFANESIEYMDVGLGDWLNIHVGDSFTTDY